MSTFAKNALQKKEIIMPGFEEIPFKVVVTYGKGVAQVRVFSNQNDKTSATAKRKFNQFVKQLRMDKTPYEYHFGEQGAISFKSVYPE